MIMSMTGYGRSNKEIDSCHVSVEIKAVNNRFCEINIRMPKQLFFLEERMKKSISQVISRGKVDVFIHIQGDGVSKKELSVDWNLIAEYQNTFDEMAEKFHSSNSFPLKELLFNEEVVAVRESSDISSELTDVILSSVEEAAMELRDMRLKEGQELRDDIIHRIDTLRQFIVKLREYTPVIQKQYRERLQRRVEEFLGGKTEIDEARILTEVSVFAEKADIQEELTRIDSHLKQFISILSDAKVIGRKLDFLVQELNREVNTIGSKSNHLETSQLVIELKAELEKIREQVQNIE
ncbi:YicC/YloC family endoribonuclease [Salipaludibacillus sp. CF4.18]|uniref:YicC/YloC family endoribonuclease n=1 Tax=Salipaludibacillus sp. CF4.18 TaxID=3373081 RepID=UPI003EE60038